MRIAIISGSFRLGRSYQENVWAEELARTGHAVRVLAAGKEPQAPRRVEAPGGGAYELQTLATRTWPRSILLSRGVGEAIREFRPDLILWLAVGHHFGKEYLRDGDLAAVPLVTTWSEHFGMHEYDWRKKGISLSQRIWAWGYWALRGRVIRAACRRSTLIVGNTPHARHILTLPFRGAERKAIDAKIADLPLGFDPKAFSFDPDLRGRIRASMGLAESNVLICASSRFDPDKWPFLTTIVEALRRVMSRRPEVRAALVGFTDSPTSRKVRDLVASGAMAERFLLEVFADRKRLNELYNASDLAVFGRASISCQESLGTGLVACFSDEGSLHHLVTEEEQAVFFRRDRREDLERAIEEAIGILGRRAQPERLARRRRLAEASRWLGYDRIIGRVLELVEQRPGPG
jgi:hypothetical protein